MKQIIKIIVWTLAILLVIAVTVVTFLVKNFFPNVEETVATESVAEVQISESNDSLKVEDISEVSKVEVELEEQKGKFLITNNSVGLFTLNDAIGNLPALYGWNSEPSSSFYDGCISPSLALSGGVEIFYKYTGLEEESSAVYKDTTKYFYNDSDNCYGYYCKDSIGKIFVNNKDFKTIEGIGVGSTFSEMQKSFPELYSCYFINVEGQIDIYISVKKYPNLEFRFIDKALTFELNEDNGSNGPILEDGSHFHPNGTICQICMFDGVGEWLTHDIK